MELILHFSELFLGFSARRLWNKRKEQVLFIDFSVNRFEI